MGIRRDRYLERLIAHKGNGRVKIVTGIRRCGKSYLLFQLFKRHLIEAGVKPNHIIEILLEDRSNKTERTGKIDSLGVSDFELDNYPALKGIQYQEKTTSIFVTRFYEDTKEMMQKGGCLFFNNQSGKPELFGE